MCKEELGGAKAGNTSHVPVLVGLRWEGGGMGAEKDFFCKRRGHLRAPGGITGFG
jgi:hypothetical protein